MLARGRFPLALGLATLALGWLAPGSSPAQERSNASRRFLGNEAAWERAALVVHQASPMFGGREYYLWGDGRLVILDFQRDPGNQNQVEERRFVLNGKRAEIAAAIRRLVDADLLGTRIEQDRPGPTCADPPVVLMRNAAGQVRSLPLLRGAPTEAYEQFLHEVATLMRLTRGLPPDFRGAYDAGFIPAGADWAAGALRVAKKVPWTSAVSPEESARQESLWREELERRIRLFGGKGKGGRPAEGSPR